MKVSKLPKTWIFDLDGTLVKHNGHKIDGEDTLLTGAKEFLRSLPVEDKIVILTSRTDEFKAQTLKFLEQNQVRFDEILFNMPVGERILVNDTKPRGLKTSIAINTQRDVFLQEAFEETDE